MNEWIDVKDELPPPDPRENIRSIRVWVWIEPWRRREGGGMRLGYYLSGSINEWRIDGSPSNWNDSVTKWMPLPDPPKVEK